MSGSYFHPIKRIFLNLSSGGTVSGDTVFTEGVYAVNLSGGTIFSGNTNLETIIRDLAVSGVNIFVQPGSNILTGGTTQFPIINLASDIILDSVNSTTISASTIFSAGTDVGNLIAQKTFKTDFNAHTGNTDNPHLVTAGQVGAYTTVQSDNLLNTKANISGSTFTGQIITPSIYATSLSANTLYSGSTNLSEIFALVGTDTNTFVTSFTYDNSNKFTILLNNGSSYSSIINNVTGLTISGGFSANTIYSGGSNLEQIIYNISSGISDTHTFVQNGVNTYTGGTNSMPTINIVDSPSFNNIYFSGTVIGGIASSVFATSISASTFVSGYTPLESVIYNIAQGTEKYITGATFNKETSELTLSRNDGENIISTGLTDYYTTGFTYNNSNKFTITDNNGSIFDATINIMTGLTVDGNLSATTINVGAFTGTSTSVATIQGTGDGYSSSSLKLYNSGGTNMYDFTDKGRFISYDPTGLVSLSLEAQGTTGVSEITTNSTTLIFQTNSGEYNFRRLTAGNILMYTNGKQFDLSATVGGAPNVTIGTNGYFGVGGTPTTLFHVFGNSYLNGGLTASTVNINNLGTGTSVYNLGLDSTGNVVTGTIGGTFTGGIVTGETIFSSGLSSTTISASTFFSGSTNLYDIFSTENYYTTGATLSGNNLIFDRNNLLSAYTVDLSSISPDLTNYITYTGATGFSQTTTATTYNDIVIDSNGIVMTNKLFYIGVNFEESGVTWNYIAPETFKINSVDNPSILTYDIIHNGTGYTLTNTINLWDTLSITGTTSTGILKLNSELI